MKHIFGYILLLLCITINAQQFNFTEHVKPIIANKCFPCHNAGGSSQVSLKNYNDVKMKATTIKNVVAHGYMPLWKPEPSYRHFQNENTLTAKELETLLSWLNSDLARGKGNDEIGSVYSKSYGKPDYTLKLPKPYVVKGDGVETYAIIKIPFEFDSAFDVRLLEFVSSQKKQIHHVSMFILEQKDGYPELSSGNDRYTFANNNFDIPEGFNVYNYLNILPQNKHDYWKLLAYKTHWQPGMSPNPYPDGTGFKMPKKGVILLDMIHYINTNKEITDDITINIYKHKQPVARHYISSSIGIGGMAEYSDSIKLQPNEKKWLYSKVKLPGDMSLFEITPHMHLIGRKFISFAVTPQNDTVPLIKIDDWDMYWQETYRFDSLLKLPKGSYIYITGYYDNSSDNPHNPNVPPKYIQNSMAKQDEMLLMILTFLEYNLGDETKKLTYNN